MKSNYKSIGPYIQLVDIKNIEDKKDNLLGVSVSKVFIKSIANTVGTDFTKYKVVKKNQFTYIPDTSRRGNKIGIALLEKDNEGLVSNAYTVFEISDTENLLPQYLMMWFRRPEFDRYARFKSHGSVREIFEWDDMCNIKLPIPPISKQKDIVNEHNVLVDRINTNNQIIQKLEETTQTIYKQWFVDFEFPDKHGKSYKSNDGEIEFNSELGKKIPIGWRVDSLSGIANYMNGLAMQNYPSTTIDSFPVIKIRELSQGFTDQVSDKANTTIPKQYIIDNGDVIFSWSGTLKVEIWAGGKGALNQHLFKVTSLKYERWFYFMWTKFHLQEFTRIAAGKAVSLGHIKREHLNEAMILIPNEFQIFKMNKIMSPLFDCITNYKIENIKLLNIKDLIHSKIAKT